MARFAFRTTLPLLLLAVLVAPGCGNNGQQLLSIRLTPATADIQNYPTSIVPFAATGTFSAPPSPQPLTSPGILWCVGTSDGVCAGNISTAASVDQMGKAHCTGLAGTVSILAGKPLPATIPDQGQPLKIFGVAQLTCH
jgi:hypothetical protein